MFITHCVCGYQMPNNFFREKRTLEMKIVLLSLLVHLSSAIESNVIDRDQWDEYFKPIKDQMNSTQTKDSLNRLFQKGSLWTPFQGNLLDISKVDEYFQSERHNLDLEAEKEWWQRSTQNKYLWAFMGVPEGGIFPSEMNIIWNAPFFIPQTPLKVNFSDAYTYVITKNSFGATPTTAEISTAARQQDTTINASMSTR